MANHKSAEKRALQTVKRKSRNASVRSQLKSFTNKFVSSLVSGDKDLSISGFSAAQSEIAKAAKKGVIHPRTAARKISRLHARLKSSV